mmetsp:Transcript_6238/g.11135  ORF Transcript_6238/g.11135 Transcript_6238/m.11135 type:complete len:213 (-) Transcript_6238:609-1247(-)
MTRTSNRLREVGHNGRVKANVIVDAKDGRKTDGLGHGGVVTNKEDAFEVEALHLNTHFLLGQHLHRAGCPNGLIPTVSCGRSVWILSGGNEVSISTSKVTIYRISVLQVSCEGQILCPGSKSGTKVSAIPLSKFRRIAWDSQASEVVLWCTSEPCSHRGSHRFIHISVRIPGNGGEEASHTRGTDEVIRCDHPHVPAAGACDDVVSNVRTGI